MDDPVAAQHQTLVAALSIWPPAAATRQRAGADAGPRRPRRRRALRRGLGVFILAVFNTSTANLVFILAFNTMFCRRCCRGSLKERPHPATLATMAVMIGGVLIIVFDGLGSGHCLGNLFALASAFVIAAAITLSRASGRDMGFAGAGRRWCFR